MGNQALDALRSDALSLSESERAELAHDLLASLDGPPDPDATDAWEAEILRRLDQIDEGTAKLVGRTELMRRIRDRLPSA
jgi:putative addiction module component (TIGR02574 family)